MGDVMMDPAESIRSMGRSADRDRKLDAIRAVAILGVVLTHSLGLSGAGSSRLTELLGLGRYGVQLFFVLSGYLMSMLYADNGHWSTRSFAIKRFGRIYPLYFVFGIFWALQSNLQSLHTTAFMGLAGTFLLFGVLTWQTAWGFLPGAWSISAEAIHYLLFIRLRQWSDRRLAALMLVLAGASALLHVAMLRGFTFSSGPDESWAYQWAVTMAPWSTIPFFTVGLLLGRHRHSLLALRTSRQALLAALAFLAFAFTWLKGSLAPIDLIWVSWLFLVIRDARVLRTSFIAWIGRRSYATYFTHFLVIDALGAAAVREEMQFERLGPLSVVALPLVVLLLSTTLSQLLWHSIEQPAIRLSRSLATRVQSRDKQTV